MSKRPQNLFEFLTGRRAHQGLKIAIGVLVKGRCRRKPELLHQVLIGFKLAADIDGNLRQGFNAAAAVLLLMQRQGRLRVWCKQERRSFARAGWPEDAHDDMPHLNLACFDPWLRIIPKLVAVGAVGVGKGVRHARRRFRTGTDPGALFQQFQCFSLMGLLTNRVTGSRVKSAPLASTMEGFVVRLRFALEERSKLKSGLML